MIALPFLLLALAAADGDEVVARVDGLAVTRAALDRRGEEFRAQGEQLAPRAVLQTLVDEAVLAAEAERAGLRKDPDVAARVEAEARRIAAEVFVDTEIGGSISPPEAALRELFHSTADFARLQLLVFETREAAQAARDRLAKGASVEAEAKNATVATVYAKDADAPYTMRAQLDRPLAEAAFRAAPGAIIGPVPLSTGHAVAKVVEVKVGTEAEYAARRDSVLQHARKQYGAQARAHYVEQLRKKAAVSLDEKFLAGLKGGEPSRADLDHVLATVNGRPLRYRDVHPAVRSIGGSGYGHMASPTAKIQIAWREVEARLVQDVATERGYGRRPEVLVRTEMAERNVLATALVERIRAQAPPPSEAEISDFYRRNAKAYGAPFEQVLPDAAARAAAEKRERTLADRVTALRKKATVTVDEAALARATVGPAR